MRKIFTTATLVILTLVLFAQAPEKMSYQAVIRDSDDNLVVETEVGMQISILQGSATGTAVYTETQTPTTNANGLVSIEIGTGTSSDDFTTIDWSTGTYFIKTETDPTGGTSYTITGISQLLSVPYALHTSVADSVINETQTLSVDGNQLTISDGNTVTIQSGTSGNEGKFIVTLMGDITDAEAAEKITNEVGSNTLYIYIKNTTQLTTVDLSGVKELVNLKISENDKLSSVGISNLDNCVDLAIEYNNSLNSLSLQSLKNSQNIDFNNNPSLGSINLSSLEFCDNLDIEYCSSLENLDIDMLKGTSIRISDCGLTSLNFPSLNNGCELTIGGCSSLTSISIADIQYAQNINISACAVSSLNFQSLDSISNLSLSGNNSLTNVDLTNLQTCVIFNIIGNSNLTSVSCPNLVSFGNFLLENNAITTSIVNDLLAQFVSISPSITDTAILLDGQTPSAPPTGQGLIDKQTLIDNGNYVETD